jgi:GNAT superfamily N-acetyltransferase
MLEKHGSVAKVAYFEEKPVGQILFYPEESNVANGSPRKDVLVTLCVYNPTSSAQKHGIGTKLLQSLILDAKRRRTCLGSKPCKFILVKAFDTGEFLSMPKFFKKNGFLPTPEREELLFLPIEGRYEPASALKEYEPLPEDRNRAVILYGPICQFSYQFAKKMEEQVREVAPNVPIELINEWEKPEESIKRRNNVLTVNAKPIKTFFMDTLRFKEEVRLALGEKRQKTRL